ncbi:MAG: MFS transporter [Spirochaetia bacterium]|nr:MFS transporter [Spirochaetia bacterium]
MYKGTIIATYIGNFVGALVTNLPPLLFVIFMNSYHLSYEQIGRLVLINFFTQIIADLANAKAVDKFGVRPFITAGHALVVFGFIILSISPIIFPSNPYAVIIIATIIFSYGGGLLELLLSAIVGAIPGDEKIKAMSLLHSFYAWGFIAVILVTTLLITVLGPENWYFIPLIWAIVPLINFILFLKVPLAPMVHHDKRVKSRTLLSSPFFLLVLMGILVGGASEVIISQWTSTFAENALGLSKATGNLIGLVFFAFFLGVGRLIFGHYGKDQHVWLFMFYGTILTIGCYLVAGLSPWPIVSLLACILSGLGVSLLWPGSIVLAHARFPHASAALFALLAAAGDTGAALGPYSVGVVTDISIAHGITAPLQMGILSATIFPIIMLITLLFIKRNQTATGLDGSGLSRGSSLTER